MLDTAPAPAKTNVEGPAEGWADVEPARKKQDFGGPRVKWVREFAFAQKGPEDKTACRRRLYAAMAEKAMSKDSLKAAEHAQSTCEKLDKMAKCKCARSDAAKLLQVAYKALTDLKTAKAKLFKALKAE
eukprot:s267_g28.t1